MQQSTQLRPCDNSDRAGATSCNRIRYHTETYRDMGRWLMLSLKQSRRTSYGYRAKQDRQTGTVEADGLSRNRGR